MPDRRTIMINAFENRNIRPKNVYQSKGPKLGESIAERTKIRSQKSDDFIELITEKDEIINKDLFKKYELICKKLYETRNTQENKKLVLVINSGLIDFEKEIRCMSKNEKTYEILDIVVQILDFNQNQEGQGLKILTPQQMLSRLPICLVQLKAGNNSQELKK